MKQRLRVLLVEDDRSIWRLLQLELEHRGMDVRVVTDGNAALPAVVEHDPQIIVLDILLPGINGEQVLRQLRASAIETPVIMLTARDSARDKVRALDGGADDYLTKPFDISELLARMRAVLRRYETDEVLRIDDLTINTATREIRRGDADIELTAREYDLLMYLAQNAGRVLTRDMILDHVWRDALDVDPNVVNVYIGYLRRKIDRQSERNLIRTVRGVGFSLRGR
ncbi:MAG: response regulator transcription factor [Thermomicrobiales bacterium]|jgi:two-component system response regulator MprA/two-component system response regulator TrcR|nr:response regulator transcription factor [Thermomicrobiales bacterium]